MPSAARRRKQISIGVVGYDPLRFLGLRAILESEPDFSLYAINSAQLFQPLQCDVVLVGSYGIASINDTIATLRAASPQLKIILTGAPQADEAMLRAIAARVRGYLDEAAPTDEYKQAIRVVHSGSMWAPRRILATFIDRVISNPKQTLMHSGIALSERERHVLELLMAGRTNKEIGAELGIEERTVKAHLSKLMQKAGVDNRIALSVYALTHSQLGS